ncbi:MAG: aminotransferase class IV [Planctomycetaceae bacterium]|nr:aminotransferase class IV [Planctomycetaceae bacterium]
MNFRDSITLARSRRNGNRIQLGEAARHSPGIVMNHQSAGPLAFLNGELLPFEEVRLPVYDLAIVQGATVTERLRTVRHQPYLVQEHLDRLDQSLAMVGWRIPGDVGPIDQVVQDLARHNTKRLPDSEDMSIVIFVTAGQAVGDANGLIERSEPTVCVYSAPLPLARWGKAYTDGVKLIVPEVRQVPSTSISPRIKMRSRLHWHLADRQARAVEAEAMALLLDDSGHVTETSSGNLFIVNGGQLCTPPDDAVLPGIARSHIIRLAEQRGWRVRAQPLSPDDVLDAEEAFLTSSTYCILPVSSLNGSRIGTSIPGRVTKMFMDAWGEEIGLDFAGQALSALTPAGMTS